MKLVVTLGMFSRLNRYILDRQTYRIWHLRCLEAELSEKSPSSTSGKDLLTGLHKEEGAGGWWCKGRAC